MNLECDSLTSCSYTAFELISEQSIYFAAKNIMDPQARNGPGMPLAIALISKIGSLSLYYGKKLDDRFIHPMPSMSYTGVKGIFGSYISDFFHRHNYISSRISTAVSIVAANILTLVEQYLFETKLESTKSSFTCDYSWKKENEVIYPNATTIAYNTFSSAVFDLFADIPNIALRVGTLFFMLRDVSKRKFSQIFTISVLSLFVHATVLRFGNGDSTFIRNCKILNSRPHIPVVMAMFLKSFSYLLLNNKHELKSAGIAILSGYFLTFFYGWQNIAAITYLEKDFFINALNSIRVCFRAYTLEGACVE